MKIAVCVKHVPAGRVRMQPDTLRIERSGPGELNAFDKHAVEAALRIAESADGGAGDGGTGGIETVVVSVGPPDAEESLRTALAMGVDRAVLVSDPAAAGSDLLGTAKLLTAVLVRESPDLSLFGQQASDGGGAVLWAAVADLLRQPFVSQASSIGCDGISVTVDRETEHGDEVITASLPALVAVSDAINEPRYTSLKGRMAAKKKPLDTLSIDDLNVEIGAVGAAGARTDVVAVTAPPARGSTVRIDDEAGAAEAIVAFLAERELV